MVLRMKIVNAAVKGAYMQSGPIQRAIYIRPPKYICPRQHRIRKLQRLSYGIVEAGCQRLCAIESWLVSIVGVGRVTVVDQLFAKRGG